MTGVPRAMERCPTCASTNLRLDADAVGYVDCGAGYADNGRSGHRCKTPEAVQATLDSLGLTSNFWALA